MKTLPVEKSSVFLTAAVLTRVSNETFRLKVVVDFFFFLKKCWLLAEVFADKKEAGRLMACHFLALCAFMSRDQCVPLWDDCRGSKGSSGTTALPHAPPPFFFPLHQLCFVFFGFVNISCVFPPGEFLPQEPRCKQIIRKMSTTGS